MIPPIFVCLSLGIPHQALSHAACSISISGDPGKAYYGFSLPNSERHFSILSVPALTIQARFAVIRLLTRFFIVLLEIKIPRFISCVNLKFSNSYNILVGKDSKGSEGSEGSKGSEVP